MRYILDKSVPVKLPRLSNGPLQNAGAGAARLVPPLGCMRSEIASRNQRSVLVPGMVCGAMAYEDWLRARQYRRPDP